MGASIKETDGMIIEGKSLKGIVVECANNTIALALSSGWTYC